MPTLYYLKKNHIIHKTHLEIQMLLLLFHLLPHLTQQKHHKITLRARENGIGPLGLWLTDVFLIGVNHGDGDCIP